jgi:ABC-type antimicrobial peptide transport system permease subunit
MLVADLWGESLQVRRHLSYALRTSSPDPTSLLGEARQAIWSVNPNLPLSNLGTLADILRRSTARTSFTLVLLGIAASVTMSLGAVGIYAVLAFAVSQRIREIGVRMALGARRSDVVRMVLRQGGLVIAGGVVIGLSAAAGLTRLMSSLLHGVGALDPLTYAGVGAGVAAVSLLASYLPARRAAAVDPAVSLRSE